MPLPSSNSRNTFLRQNSSPEIKSSTIRTTLTVPVSRSKTPPPPRQIKINACSAAMAKTSQKSQTSIKCTAVEYAQRSRSKVVRSTEELSTNINSKTSQKSNKEMLSAQESLDLKYNAYLQTCLMVTYNKNFRKMSENKIADVLEGLQTKLMQLDTKICKLDVYLGKVLFLRNVKAELEKRILDYGRLNDLINSSRLHEYINFLEQDLIVIRLKNFHIPSVGNDIDEILKYFQNIINDLRSLSNVEEKTFPLSQLRSSIEKSKHNIREEISLKHSCQRKLAVVEELICHESYLKSFQI